MDLVTQLLIFYAAILLINLAISAIMWTYARTPMYRDVFFLWLATIASLLIQGALGQSDFLIVLGFSSAFFINIALANLLSSTARFDVPWYRFVVVMLASLVVATAAHFAGLSFTWIALPVVLAVAYPALDSATRVFFWHGLNPSLSIKALAIITFLLALHNIDFAFLRKIDEFAPVGFSIALILIFCLSIFAPAVVLEAVTEKQTALKEIDRLKSAFFTNVSHEIRTPLTMILSPVEALLQGDYRGNRDELLRSIHRHSVRLLGLINNILDFSKLEAGSEPLTVRKSDIVRFVRTRIGTVREAFDVKGVTIEVVSLNKEVWLWIDGEQFDKVILNLFSNALKFTPRGGRVTVRIRDDADHCFIECEDTGEGIPESKVPYVLDRFTQLDTTSAHRHEGIGIGLALASEVAKRHGGAVTIESRYVDKYPEQHGTTIEVRLPKGKSHFEQVENVTIVEDGGTLDSDLDAKKLDAVLQQADAAGEGAPEAKSDQRAVEVLVVESDADLRRFLRRLLEPHFEVATAETGADGLVMARAKRPQVIVTDAMLPVMSGSDFIEALREDEQLKGTPILLLSSQAELHHKLEGLEQGADDYLTKPFNVRELLARIRSLMRVRRLQNELQALNADLSARVEEQVVEVERLGRLKRFFSPQVAEMIVGGETEDPLKVHRRDITAVFLDLRGFTSFAETAEPEDVMSVLHEYHSAMGELILKWEGTLEHFAGDGIMVFFNDPVPVDEPEHRAIQMAMAMRERTVELAESWRARGLNIEGVGVGVASGFAAIGAVGFQGRWEYGAIGTVTNLAARLCGEAKPGQVLVTQRLVFKLGERLAVNPVGTLNLKGFHEPVPAFEVTSLRL